jgi:hypothetical protein
MTFAKEETSVATRVVAAIVGLASAVFMLGLFQVSTAQAQQSNAELQAQIQSLLDTIDSLQAQVDGQSSGSSADPYMNCNPAIFDARIGQGASGQGVVALQQFLNMSADTRVAASGPGSPGNETSFYGPLTSQAVTAFQEKYSADVLAPVGLSSGTGYWGSSTASKAEMLCTTNASDDSMDDSMDDSSDDLDDILDDGGDDSDDSDESDDSDDEDEEELSGGEASLEGFDLDGEDDVDEGSSAEVASFEFDVEEGDIEVQRVDASFTRTAGNGDDEPWDVFEEITLMAGGDEIASADASDEDAWLDDDGEELDTNNSPGDDSDVYFGSSDSDDGYTVRFNGVDTIVRDGDTAEMSLEVETTSSVDDAGNAEWGVWLKDEGVRARDGAGLDQYVGDNEQGAEFSIDEEGEGEELSFSESSDNPDSSILPVNEDDTSDDYGIFVFDVEADGGDISIEELPISFRTLEIDGQSDGLTFDDVVDEAYLEVDGEEYDDYDVDSEDSGTESSRNFEDEDLTFNIDDDIEVEEDDEVTMTLFTSFRDQDGNYEEGTSVQAEMTSGDVDNVDAEGADDVESGDLDGSPSGEIHDLRTQGLYIEEGSTDTSTNTNDSGETTQVTHTIEYDLTAFEEDFFVPRGATQLDSGISYSDLSDPDEVGATYRVEDDNGDVVDGTSSASLSSTADQATNAWQIDEGDTETFTLQVILNNNNYTGFNNVQLDVAAYNENEGASDNDDPDEDTVQAVPQEDFETDQVNLD